MAHASQVTTVDRPITEVIAGPARPLGSSVLRELSNGSTEVTFTMDLQPGGFLVLMTPRINKQVRAEVGNIANLADAMAG